MATTLTKRPADELDGSTTTDSADVEITQDDAVTLLYVNDLDVDVTVDPQLTRRDDVALNDAVSGGSVAVAAGARDFDTLHRDVWERIGASISYNSNPSTGSIAVYLIREA
jgi:hypothetical protein